VYILFSVVATALVMSFLTYVALILLPFLRLKPEPSGDPAQFEWHFFVPCRDEEAVIDVTMERLRTSFPGSHVWVIDDDSDDRTAELVARRRSRDPLVHLVQRRRPDARIGKGAALNAAYEQLIAWMPEDADHRRSIVCVVDADGEMADNALEAASGPRAFGDPRVGATQVTVRMKNRNDKDVDGGFFRSRFSRYLVRMQDLEFRTIIAGMQSLRTSTGTVGLGGNGQFTRLSVLDEIGRLYGEPWHGSLLEDYELGVHVLLAGHEIRHLHDTHVEQEGLVDLSRFLTQRTRWAQGNIQCAKYLRDIIGSRHFDGSGVVESAYYLVLPFLQLIGFATWLVLAVFIGFRVAEYPGGPVAMITDNWGLLVVFLIVGVGPFAVWGPVYRSRCERGAPWYMGVVWGLGQWVYSFYTWVTAPRAFSRVIRGKQGWAKTRRNGERVAIGVVAKES